MASARLRTLEGIGRVLPASASARPEPGGRLELLLAPGETLRPAAAIAGPNDGRLLTVLGSDDRERPRLSTQPPLRAICALRMVDARGNTGIGTGTLIGRRSVLTCAHNLLQRPPARQWDAVRVDVRPGCEVGAAGTPFGTHIVQSANWWIHPDWQRSQAAGTDIALLPLAQPVGEDTGHLGVAALRDAALEARMVNLAGYPACVGRCRTGPDDGNLIPAAERGAQLWWQRDRILRADADQIFYDLDTFGGNSGSPVILMPTAADGWAGPTLLGIHTRGLDARVGVDPFERAHNTATRITDAILDMILAWLDRHDGG